MCKIIVCVSLGILGLFLALGGVFLIHYFPIFLESKIKEESRLINGSDAFERWRKIPIPLTMKFHIFEIRNPDTYTSLNDIKLAEKGPYVFDETRVKENIVFYTNDNNESLVSFRDRRHYIFREDLSDGHYDDNITFINLPLLGILFNEVLIDGLFGYEMVADILDENEKALFTTRSVGQLLFDGINLKITHILSPYLPLGSGITLKPFSIIEGRSELIEEMSIFTGIDSMDKFGQIFRFDNKYDLRNDDLNHSYVWPFHDPSHSCNQIIGTDGSFYQPYFNRDQILYAFEPKICRSMSLKYLMPSEVRGIQTLKYWLPKEEFENPLKVKKNSCYCLKRNATECNINGVLQISNCLRVGRGAPAVVSQPYFLFGDQHLRDDIHLVPPQTLNFENYGTFIDVEPLTGTVLRVCRRIQMNVKIRSIDSIPQLKATKPDKDYIIPALWLEESAEVNEELANKLKTMIFDKQTMVTYMSLASLTTGLFLILMACFLTVQISR